MALDPSIPLQAKNPDINPLATLLQIGQYKYLQQNSNRLQMDTDANTAVGQAIQRNTGADGKVNLLAVQRGLAGDPSAAYNLQGATGQNLVQQGQQTANAGQQISNDANAQALAAKRGEAVAKAGVSLLANPKATGADYIGSLRDLHKNGIIDDKTYINSMDEVGPHVNDVPALQQIVRGMLSKLPDAIQQAYVTPSGVLVNNGQKQVLVNTNPVAAPIGPVEATAVQNELPPNTPTYDQQTGTPGYLGPQASKTGGFDPSQFTPEQLEYMKKSDPTAYANGLESFMKRGQPAAPARVVSGPPVGAVAGVEGSQASINDHWKSLNDQASKAGTDIGILQNIKQLAHNAVTGQLSDKESFVNGLAARLGMSSADLKKTDTDLLAKNAAMLALTGGNTDAARALAEAANPNVKMNEPAIRHAADQIIGQKQMAIAQQQFLLPFKAMADQGHPDMYQAAKAKFDAAADPRILQLPNMAPEDVAKMKASMSPKERIDFGEKIRALQSLGVVK
jgi:hypothetical protein